MRVGTRRERSGGENPAGENQNRPFKKDARVEEIEKGVCKLMAVTIQPNSAKAVVTVPPGVVTPFVDVDHITFMGTWIRATGEVTLLGDSGDSAADWRVGFIQVQAIETSWAVYRGKDKNDGSIFLQRARPPARPQQGCLDCENQSSVLDLFISTVPAHGYIVSGKAGGFPQILQVKFRDKPGDICPLVEQNTLTGKPNFLVAAQTEFAFCTILSVRDPGGMFYHQLSFCWNVSWQANFTANDYNVPPTGFKIDVVQATTGAGVSPIVMGPPTDPKYTNILTTAQTKNCNQLGIASHNSPNRHENRVNSALFDVRLA